VPDDRRQPRQPTEQLRQRVLANKRMVAVVAVAAGAIGVLMATSTGSGPHALICSGQCKAPYQLQVFFKPGTSDAGAARETARCRSRREVQRVGTPRTGVAGLVVVPVYTRDLGKGPRTDGLLACLAHQPGVLATGWPK
jgi:hypothetical protein